MRWLLLTVVVVAVLFAFPFRPAAPPLVVRTWPSPDGSLVARKNMAMRPGKVEIVDKAGVLLWEMALDPDDDAPDLEWSAQGNWLAVLQRQPARLRLWTAKGVRTFRGPWAEGEGALGLLFSPDRSFLLLRIAPVFGNYDIDAGILYSLDLRTGTSRLLANSVRQVTWLDNRRVRCLERAPEERLIPHELVVVP